MRADRGREDDPDPGDPAEGADGVRRRVGAGVREGQLGQRDERVRPALATHAISQ